MILTRMIDLDSIKKNPDAGKSVFFLPGPITKTEKWDMGHQIEIRTNGIVTMITTTSKPTLAVPKLLETIEERDVQTVRTMEPEPEFFFKYAPLTVTCKSCKASFDFSKLESDSGCGTDDDWQSDTICPECHEMECLEDNVIEENIEQALHRLSKVDLDRFCKLNGSVVPS